MPAAVFSTQISQGNRTQALKAVFSNPEYLKSFMTAAGAKMSTDFMISYAGDLAMMGILDTNDDWESLLKANLTGVLLGLSGDVKGITTPNAGKIKLSDRSDVRGQNDAVVNHFDRPNESIPGENRTRVNEPKGNATEINRTEANKQEGESVSTQGSDVKNILLSKIESASTLKDFDAIQREIIDTNINTL